MTLKTLKDCIWNYTVEDSTDESEMWERKSMADDLKQEAIKWIKLMDKELKDLRPHNLTNYHEKVIGLVATREWVVMFFNITEEDLK